MKRTIWITAAALVIAAVATIPLVAQPPQGRGGRGFGPGGPGGPFPMLRALDLTDAQREQIRAITNEQRSGQRRGDAGRPQSKVAELQKQLQLAIMADTPDLQKIDELKAAITTASAEELAARVEMETRIAQVLTPAQRAQAREALAKTGPPNRPPNGGRRGR